MKVLGIDPGYATTGFGLLRAERGQYGLLQYGVITTDKELPFAQRLDVLYQDMVRLLEVTAPDAVAVEELFWGHNITTGIGVSHGRGKAPGDGYDAAAFAYAAGRPAGRRGGRHRHCAVPREEQYLAAAAAIKGERACFII